jgi:hypothetical protein
MSISMKKPLSQPERILLREAWKHEANDFTPWLAEEETLGWQADVGYTPLNAGKFDNLDPRLISGQLQLLQFSEASVPLMDALQ